MAKFLLPKCHCWYCKILCAVNPEGQNVIIFRINSKTRTVVYFGSLPNLPFTKISSDLFWLALAMMQLLLYDYQGVSLGRFELTLFPSVVSQIGVRWALSRLASLCKAPRELWPKEGFLHRGCKLCSQEGHTFYREFRKLIFSRFLNFVRIYGQLVQ